MSDKDDFYKFFDLSKVSKNFKKKQELYKLFEIPKKELMPRFYNFEANHTQQCDILYLPDDRGFKYCLVVVDVATSRMDAVPLRVIDAETVLRAILQIYKRGFLKMPTELITDQGSEFKGKFAEYFKKHKIYLKNAVPGRHRQVSMAEKMNQVLGKVLHMSMYAQELLTGELNREWLDDLPEIINKINERYSHKPYTEEELAKRSKNPLNTKQEIIPVGTRVRVALDEPRDVTGKKLHGKFRSSDPRWTTKVYKVVNFIIDPFQPILYEIDMPVAKNERVAFTKERLQVVKDDEEEPPAEIILKNKKPNQYIVNKILDSKKVKGKTLYKIRWKGFKADADSWEPADNLPKKLLHEYELEQLI
jgi:hypothetical protein